MKEATADGDGIQDGLDEFKGPRKGFEEDRNWGREMRREERERSC